MAVVVSLADPQSMQRAIYAARGLPPALRNALKLDVNTKVVSPVAKEVQAVAGSSAIKAVNAFKSKGVLVKPGEKPILVVGGPESYGRTTMRTIAGGAEWGGSNRHTTYPMKGRRTGRGRHNAHWVRRRVTREFGTQVADGRFVHPTITRMLPVVMDAYVAILQGAVEMSSRG